MDADQYLIQIPADYLARSLIETIVAAVALVWCLRQLGRGAWATTASLGALAYTLGAGAWASMALPGTILRLDVWIVTHGGLLDWVRVGGAAVLLLSLTLARRMPRARPAG